MERNGTEWNRIYLNYPNGMEFNVIQSQWNEILIEWNRIYLNQYKWNRIDLIQSQWNGME